MNKADRLTRTKEAAAAPSPPLYLEAAEISLSIVTLDGEEHHMRMAAAGSIKQLCESISAQTGQQYFRLFTDEGVDLLKGFDVENTSVAAAGIANTALTIVDEGLDELQVKFQLLLRASLKMKRHEK